MVIDITCSDYDESDDPAGRIDVRDVTQGSVPRPAVASLSVL
jgi:hypothetical protein